MREDAESRSKKSELGSRWNVPPSARSEPASTTSGLGYGIFINDPWLDVSSCEHDSSWPYVKAGFNFEF